MPKQPILVPGTASVAKLRAYRAALIASLVVNAVLIGAIALYIHFAGLLDVVETAIGILG